MDVDEVSREEFEELSDEQKAEYNEKKAKQLLKQAEQYKSEQAQKDIEGLSKLVDDVEGELTEKVDIAGNKIEVFVDPDEADLTKIKKIHKQYGDKEPEDLAEGELDEIKDTLFEVLGEFTTEWEYEDWKDGLEDRGLRTVMYIARKVFETVEEEFEKQKKGSRTLREGKGQG